MYIYADLNLVNQKEFGVFVRRLEEATLHCFVILVDNIEHTKEYCLDDAFFIDMIKLGIRIRIHNIGNIGCFTPNYLVLIFDSVRRKLNKNDKRISTLRKDVIVYGNFNQ